MTPKGSWDIVTCVKDDPKVTPWLDLLVSGKVTTFGGLGIVVAIVLLLALRVLLPRQQRRQIRVPLTMLLLHVTCVLSRVVLPADSGAQHWLSLSALFFIMASMGNAAFVLVIDWFVGHRLGRPLPRIFRDIIAGIVYVVVSFITLRAVGVEPGSLLTTSALLTAVIALSLQDTLGNLFAGLALEAQRPFALGDWIGYDADPDHIGCVTEMNWRATKILTNDGVEIIIPNGALAKMPIVNYTQPTPVSRRSVSVRAPLDVPPLRVQEAILGSLHGTDGVLESPAPFVTVDRLDETAVVYKVRYYIDRFGSKLQIESLVRFRVWYAMARAGIPLPVPAMDVGWTDASREAGKRHELRVAERERDIRQVGFLAVLEDDAIMALAERTEIRLYTAGETVIEQGGQGNELFIVRTGEVSVIVEKDGQKEEVARLGPGKFFGEMSLMTGEKRSATVRAVDACELLVVGHAAFKSILLAHPEAAESVSKALARRRARLDERMSLTDARPSGDDREHESALLSRIRSFFKL